ncbi:osmotically-inducible lipoprotein OsmE [Pseudomonas sp. KK4]|uniref:osmotically-inducible lipoprotein OsmE n=1 Tax=Pseudomonas sp. KK4 TaxID=1855729 RepID=UPI00097C593E|nr:osmotically-inducible lipoprotein OsmE [Pseudomonas sp. KK4]
MNTSVPVWVLALVTLAGCSSDARVFRDQPLVAKVEIGMNAEQVQQIGGAPLSISPRTVEAGTCYDYKLVQPDHRQPYNISFDSRGKVDHKGFMTCAEWSNAQRKAREPSRSSGGGGY